MKYLLYKDYESGLNNEVLSVELAVGLAYLTQRKLVYYGSVGEDKKLIHVRGSHYWYVPPHRQGIINNEHNPTILDILEELPVEMVSYPEFLEDFQTHQLSQYNSPLRLVNAVFMKEKQANQEMLNHFLEGRSILTDVPEEVFHIYECNLGYYSRFFYLSLPSLTSILQLVQPRQVYRNLATKIVQSLGKFNGVHIRLTDFRKFLPQDEKNYPHLILQTLKSLIDPDQLLVISTDESENKEFFAEILKTYQNSLFLDELIVQEFPEEFTGLPFTDEAILGLICNLIMPYSEEFVGTPGSTFSGVIHRRWLERKIQQGNALKNLMFKYINSGFPLEQVPFKNGCYVETNTGFFSWNRFSLPLHTETKSWFREWPESVVFDI